MIVPAESQSPAVVDYPDDDGNPMSDNTLQFQWIVTLQGGLDDLFRDNPDVFVAGNLLWYPVLGDNTTRVAPDALVAFGRPKGYRGSYQQWHENGVAPQVVFEVLSPSNGPREMARKRLFYEQHGVEEFYIYDPDDVVLTGYLRSRTGTLSALADLDGFRSPRLGVRFDMSGAELVIHRPDGGSFLTYLEQCARAAQEAARADHAIRRATQEAKRADKETQRAEAEARRAAEQAQRAEAEAMRAAEQAQRAAQETQRAEAEAKRAAGQTQLAAQEAQRADELQRKMERLRAKMIAAGLDPDANDAE